MDFGFTEDQEVLRKSAREVLAERSTSGVVRAVMDSESGFDEALWKTISELGWLGVAIPESEGGLGLGWIEQCILLEEAGRAILPSPYATTVALALPVLLLADASAERSRLLNGIAEGTLRVTLAALEADGNWDVTSFDTTAAKDGDAYRIRGTKVFVPDAHAAHELLVVAKTAAGYAVFSVPASEATITQLPTIDRTRRLCEVSFDGARGQLVATGAADLLRRALDRAAVGLAAEQTGIAQQALELTVAYAKEREQFGKKIGTFQAVSHRLAEMLLLTESARSSVFYAAWALEEGEPTAPLAAATARVAGIQAGRFATAEGIQLHGGIGFTWEHDMHLFYKRAKWDELYLGEEGTWKERVAELLASS
jgi:alkylation response protein AidB-like acyl-CoA dehydrogenase